MGDTNKDDDREFLLLKYELDRQHELELDKVLAQYEIAFLQVSLLLNGASATAFVSLLGDIYKELFEKASLQVYLCLTFWLLGVLFALISGFQAYKSQKSFVRAYRSRRNAISVSLLRGSDELLLSTKPHATPESLGKEANEARDQGSTEWKRVRWLGSISIVFFALGVGTAALALTNAAKTSPAKSSLLNVQQ
jgi:hypothetical protein